MKILSCIALMMIINFGRTQVDTSDVKNENGILVFRDAAHLLAYGDKLAAAQAEIDKQIDARCPKKDDAASDDDYDECRLKAAQELGNAYEQAEEALGFKSLRAHLQAQRDRDLQSDGSDKANIEANAHFVGLDQDQAVLSPAGAVRLGDTYYLLTQEGELKFATRAELDKYLNTSLTQAAVLGGSKRRLQSWLCKTNVHNSGYVYCNEKRRIRFRVGHYWWFFNYRAYAYTACQRRLFWGWFWFPTINVNFARVYGSVSAPEIVGCSIQNNNCNKQHNFNTVFPITSAIAFGFSVTHTVCVPTKTKSGWIFGDHYSSCCPNFKFSSKLTF